MAMLKNKAQEEAIKNINGPLIIIACPGSGKTTTLIRRIKNIIDHNVNPKKILMVTFANSAAKDMNNRYKKMYGENPGITFSTIHSLCFNILKKENMYDKGNIISEDVKMDFFINYLKRYSEIGNAWDIAKKVITEISVIKNNFINLDTYEPESVKREIFLKALKKYEDYKKMSGFIDFDDMLIEADKILSTNKNALKKWQDRFDYIQCDEYQDTNFIQKNILYTLAGDKKNLCVVGDDDQSIYRFRGADSSIMMNFNKDFPRAKTIYMSTNYRSCQKIVDIADICIRHNIKRFDKSFISQRGLDGLKGSVEYKQFDSKFTEMAYIKAIIERRHKEGIKYKDMAILFRNNKQASVPVFSLSKDDIPYNSTEKVKTVYQDWIFKDILCYIELSMGINVKTNLMKALNRPNRFLNPKYFYNTKYSKKDMINSLDYLMNVSSKEFWRYESARKKIEKWMMYFGPGKIDSDTPVDFVFEGLETKGLNYIKFIKNVVEFRKEDLGEVYDEYNLLKEDAFKCKTVGKWLEYADFMIRKTEEGNKKSSKNGVVLTTMHKSKGMEWKDVYIINVNDDIIPTKQAFSQDDIEEERRLLYVAMTRAKDRLFISYNGIESPFMSETMSKLRDKYDPKIIKKLAGTVVKHKKYGFGKIANYSNDVVNIKFDTVGYKAFKFPDAFKKGLLEYV